MVVQLFVALFASAPPSIVACDTGTVCSEVMVASGEAPRCAGKPVPRCNHAAAATCALGDTTLYFALQGASGEELAGALRGASSSCHANGGSFSVGGKKKDAPKPPATTLSLPSWKATLKAAKDCEPEDVFGSIQISCGKGERPDVKLTVTSYTGDFLQPKDANAALASVREGVTTGTVDELDRKASKGSWIVAYRVAAPHGVPALGFQQVRPLGKDRVLCTGSAWSKADLDEARAMCATLKR